MVLMTTTAIKGERKLDPQVFCVGKAVGNGSAKRLVEKKETIGEDDSP